MNHEEILHGVMLSIEKIYKLQSSLSEFDSENTKLILSKTLGMMEQMLDSFGVPDEPPQARKGFIDGILNR